MRIFIRYFKFHLPQFYQILQRKFIAVSKNFFHNVDDDSLVVLDNLVSSKTLPVNSFCRVLSSPQVVYAFCKPVTTIFRPILF